MSRVCDYTDDCGDNSDEIACSNYPGRCDFEQGGTCDWSQMTDDQFDWTLSSGYRCKPETGPCIDHTKYTRDGHYLFVNSGSQVSNDLARIISPTMALAVGANSDDCTLRLYYHMWGENIRRLAVYTRTQNGGPLTRVMSKNGNQGSMWGREDVKLQATAGVPFQVIIEGKAPNTNLGDIAIDDISFSSGCVVDGSDLPPGTTVASTTVSPCPDKQFHCGDNTCIDVDKYCDGSIDCLGGSDEATCGDCTFESDACGWFDSSSGLYKWDRIQGVGSSEITQGPNGDHTTESITGWYMFVSSSTDDFINYAHLYSPVQREAAPSCKMNFWYYMYSSNTNAFDAQLSVMVISGSGSEIKWSTNVNAGDQWNNANVLIGAQEHGYDVMIEAYLSIPGANIAIDDVTFTDCLSSSSSQCDFGQFRCDTGACIPIEQRCDFVSHCQDNSDETNCPTYQACDFNTDLCYWESDLTSSSVSLQRGILNDGTAPPADHNSNFGGSYIYVSASSQNVNKLARLLGPLIAPVQGDACVLRLYKNIYNSNIGKLDISIRTISGIDTLIYSLSTVDNDLSWKDFSIPLNSFEYFQVVLDVVRLTGTRGTISIDDVSFSPSCKIDPNAVVPCSGNKLPCNDGYCLESEKFCNFFTDCPDLSDELACPSQCDFESDMCGWSNDQQNAINWEIQKGSASSPIGPGGPSGDHTTGETQGTFAILKVTSPTTIGSKSQLLSAQYSQSGVTCNFNFWYYMYGDFAILKVLTMSGNEMREIWQVQGSFGSTWFNKVITMPTCLKDFQVVFQVEITSSNTGSVAIDDVIFQSCDYPEPTLPANCPAPQKQCSSGHCVSEDSWCDFNYDCCDASDEDAFVCASYSRCNFERDFCDWKKTQSSGSLPLSEWTVGTTTSPAFDHTTGQASGQYAYIDTSTMTNGGEAQLHSFVFTSDSVDCFMRFYSYLEGTGATSLAVKVATKTGEVLKQTINMDTSNTQWTRRSVQLTPVSEAFQVVISGLLTSGNPGVIAIDDVSFSEGCYKSPVDGPIIPGGSTTVSPPYECDFTSFYCSSDTTGTECIPTSKKCDFNRDCSDASDESNCPILCNFDGRNSLDGSQCGWKEDPGTSRDLFNWIISEANADTSGLSPTYDHTSGTATGGLAYILKTGFEVVQAAEFFGPTLNSAHSTCQLEFWYYQRGSAPGQIDIVLTEYGESDEVSLMTLIKGDKGDSWKRITLDVGKRTVPFSISIIKVDEGSYDAQTGIDDIQMKQCSSPLPSSSCSSPYEFSCATTKACVNKRSAVCDGVDDCGDESDEQGCNLPLITNFEFNLGSWKQEPEHDDFDWSLTQGPSSTADTGPFRDHTTSTKYGWYLNADASSRISGERAWINSPVIKKTTENPTCDLRFWYYMDGIDVHRLSVYTKTYTNGGWNHLKDIFSPSISTIWNRASIPLGSIETSFMVVIEAVIGNGPLGDIAIDDISFSTACTLDKVSLPSLPGGGVFPTEPSPPSTCNANEYSCRISPSSESSCISMEKLCDFRSDCYDGSDETGCVSSSCDFESDICGWFVSNSQPSLRSDDDFTWLRGQPNIMLPGESGTRPTTDHTLMSETGYYLYADSSIASSGVSAQLFSSNISASGPQCTLRFFYWMGDSDEDIVGSLHVYTHYQYADSNDVTQVWSKIGFQGAGWHEARVFIGHMVNFQIEIEARRYNGDKEIDITLDDLEFQDCAPTLPSDVGCGSNQFSCANQVCVSQSVLCDFSDDCGDASDELNGVCYLKRPRCDFEYDLCQFKREASVFPWQLSNARSQIGSPVLPTSDHSLRQPEGHFIFADPMIGSGASYEGYARIGTPGLFLSTSSGCVIRFYYQIHSTLNDIKLYARTQWESNPAVGLNLIYTLSTDSAYYGPGDFWQRVEVPITSDADFQVIFEAVYTSTGYTSAVAIDDISFSDGCVYDESGTHGEVPSMTPPPSNCGNGFYQCSSGGCYDDTQRCDFLDACGDGQTSNPSTDENTCGSTCNFEIDSCGWSNSDSVTYNFDWSLNIASQSPSSGPNTDHTTGSPSGSYMSIITGTSAAVGAKAHLVTDMYQRSAPSCSMSFYYNIKSNNNQDTDAGSLRVLKRSGSSNEILYNVPLRQGNTWTQGRAEIGHERSFQIVFEVINGAGNGYVALDDVVFSGCGDQSAGQSCGVTAFTCSSGQCIFLDEVCNQRDDCDDGSDEVSCSLKSCDCNFDSTVWGSSSGCKYIQDQNDNYDWKLSDGTGLDFQNPVLNGPQSDHTPGSSGKFAMVSVSELQMGNVAKFTTQCSLPASSDVCTLRFWYFMSGTDTSTILRVYVVSATSSARHVAAVFVGNTAAFPPSQWTYASVPISSHDDFRVEFMAEAGNDASVGGYIAVDDVSFTEACRSGEGPTPKPIVCESNQFQCISNNNDRLECMPNQYKCDGFQDCRDGSDELGCTKPESSTIPNQGTGKCEDDEFLCANNTCIPGLMVCDGVVDCDSSDDEKACPLKVCSVGFYLCLDGDGSCLSSESQCDGESDCSKYKADESLCGYCPTDYCQNGGQCSISGSSPLCRCPEGYVGTRCQMYKPVNPTSSTIESLDPGTIAGIVIGCIAGMFLLLVAVFLVYNHFFPQYRKRKALIPTYDNPIYDTTPTYGSSTFGDISSGIEVREMTTKSIRRKSSDGTSGGFVNPGFGEPPSSSVSDVYATVGGGPSRKKPESNA